MTNPQQRSNGRESLIAELVELELWFNSQWSMFCNIFFGERLKQACREYNEARDAIAWCTSFVEVFKSLKREVGEGDLSALADATKLLIRKNLFKREVSMNIIKVMRVTNFEGSENDCHDPRASP